MIELFTQNEIYKSILEKLNTSDDKIPCQLLILKTTEPMDMDEPLESEKHQESEMQVEESSPM